jgi:predicted O-methyltransferase YrrM
LNEKEESIMWSRPPENGVETTTLLAFYRSEQVYQEMLALKQRLSMLHADVLMLLYHLGGYCAGAVLEIGPYIGGATTAMAQGMVAAGRQRSLVCVEKGGAFSDRSELSSLDVVSDLEKNLTESGVRQLVDIVCGDSRDVQTVARTGELVKGGETGLLVLDSDGRVGRDMQAYADRLKKDCYIVIDDYLCPGNSEKGDLTRRAVDHLVDNDFMECYGLYGWGTWIGRRTGKALPDSVADLD